MTKGIYYQASSDDDHTSAPCSTQKRRLDTRNEKKARSTHSKKTTPSLLDGVMAPWTRSSKQSKENQERTAASEVARSREKVQTWIDSEADFNSRAVTRANEW